MKYDSIYERRQSAGKMEVVLLAASALGAVAAVFILLEYGWVLATVVFLLSLIAYAVSRLFDLLSDLFGCVGRLEEDLRGSQKRKDEPES